MAISNFIPTVWSENLYTQLDKKYIAVNHCNREFEGDIKEKGCTVNIVEDSAVDRFIGTVGKHYTERTGLTASFYVVSVGGGPREI